MLAHNILVVVVDGLRASALGAYGNTSFPTPALDRFAAESFLLDSCFARSVDFATIYRDLWQTNAGSLPLRLKSLGYTATIVTDDPAMAALPGASEFDQCVQLSERSSAGAAAKRATDSAHTALASLFGTAADVLASGKSAKPQFVWLHSRGMYGAWDAPLELQLSLLDESDPPPVEDVAPPDFVAGDDPDAVFRYACAYAAQVMVLDECWESLMSALDSESENDRWLTTMIGARGFPLGEHGRVGDIDSRLYGEQLHVPWLVRFPDGAGCLARSSQLTTHGDLAPTLVDSTTTASVCTLVAASRAAWRDALVARSAEGNRAIRTADWCLRELMTPDARSHENAGAPSDASPFAVELFVRPDDRWEANDVAKLCPDVVDSLIKRLDESSDVTSET